MKRALLYGLFLPALWAQVTAPPRPAAPHKVAVPSYEQLKYPPLKPIQIPNVASYTLPNGMKLYLLEDHELPLVHGVARIRTGNLFDPPDKVGLATVTGVVLRSGGTQSKTGDEIDQQLENIAASIESGIGESSGSVSFSMLKENTDEVLGLFQELLMAPAFRQDKIDLIKAQLRSGISRRNDDAADVAQREFTEILYGRDTPYGWRIEYATLDRIGRGDVEAFYKRYFFPANIMLAVWGDFSTAEMKARLEKLFAGWNYQQPKVPPFPPVQKNPAPGVYLATKDDVTQSTFIIGHYGGELRDPDYASLEVMSDILGGGFSSRLFRLVRTKLGLAYSISANWGADYDHPGLFSVFGSTKSDSTVEAIQAAEQEIRRMGTAEVTGDELKTAKETALNSLVFAFDTKTKTLGRLLTYEYYGYPKDFIQQYQKALASVSKTDVLQAARQHLKPGQLTVVVVGKPADFGKPLATLGTPVTSIDLTIPEPKAESKSDEPAKRP